MIRPNPFKTWPLAALLAALTAALLSLPALAEPVRLGSVRVVAIKGRAVLMVSAPSKVAPKVEDSGAKIVVRVPGSLLASQKQVEVNLGAVQRLRPGQHGDESWIVLDMNRKVRPKGPRFTKAGFRIDLGPVGSAPAKASRPKAASPVAAVEQPAEEAESLDPGGAGLTYRVVDVSVQEGDDRCQLVISADGPARFKPSRLDGGKLISVSLLNSSLAWVQGANRLSCQGIEKVEVGQAVVAGQAGVKVNIYLKEPLAFTINRDQNQVVVSVEHPVAKAAPVNSHGSLDMQLSVDVQNADLVGTLKTLAQQAGFEFYFTTAITALVPPASLVTLHLDKQPFSKIINDMLTNANMSFDVQGNTVYFGSSTEIAALKKNLPRITRYYTPRYSLGTVFKAKMDLELAADPILKAGVDDQADPDTASQALVFTATKEDMAKVMAIVARVDAPPKGEEGADEDVEAGSGIQKTQVFRLRYTDPTVLSDPVTQILTPFGGAVQGTVKVDARSRSLIVTAASNYLKKVRELLDRLDVQLPQVSIEAKIVEVDLDSTNQLGIVWNGNNPAGANPSLNGLVNAPTGGVIGQLAVGILQNGYNISATIQALATENKADILSSPKIMAQDNQAATITTSDIFYYQTTTITNGTGTSTVNTTFNPETVPITLNVTPQINEEDNDVRMLLSFNVSSVTSQVSPGAPPNTSTQQATTYVKVKNGETAVVGGLIRNVRTNTDNKVPILGDIPLLGLLFRSHSVQVTKRELVVLLTPTIVEN